MSINTDVKNHNINNILITKNFFPYVNKTVTHYLIKTTVTSDFSQLDICDRCLVCSQRLTTFVLMPVFIQIYALCGHCHVWWGTGCFKSRGEGSNAESHGSEQYSTTPTFSHTFNNVTQWPKSPDSCLIVPGDPFSLETYYINKHISFSSINIKKMTRNVFKMVPMVLLFSFLWDVVCKALVCIC